MTTDIELAQSLKRRATSANEFGESLYVKGADVIALVEAVEKAQGMETYWKTQCRGITDHCEELQARIAELESHTVKPPVHPTVASENLDDETLQELIEFRRTTFEYHSKEGNKVQTIIHGVTLAALRELQERRKADSEPVAEVVSIYGDPEAFGEREIRPLVGIQQMPYGTKLYRHARPVPVVSADLLHTAASAIEDLLTTKDRTGACVWFDLPFRLRSAANAQPAPVVPDGYVKVPMRLTAENGAKGALSGEFSETKFVNCPECFGDDECETCDGSGRIEITVPVTWTTIKEIWAKGVEHFSATPREVKGE
ncbi:hypothetical protein M3B59_00280 [Klebsiella variicola]|nr:hypothetical protein [Klebsiella variicola]